MSSINATALRIIDLPMFVSVLVADRFKSVSLCLVIGVLAGSHNCSYRKFGLNA